MLRLALLLTLVSAGGCTVMGSPICTDDTPQIVKTVAGPEDIVRLDLSDGEVGLFVREVSRIGYVDVRSGWAGAPTKPAWSPPDSPKSKLLGMSLVPGPAPGSGTLYVIDKAKAVRIWRLTIKDSKVVGHHLHYPEEGQSARALENANDLHATGETLYVTRFDWLGGLRSGRDWPGVVRVGPGSAVERLAPGVRGANGIVQGRGQTLVVSDYWEQRLRLVDATDTTQEAGYATARLDISPDNLTRHGSTIFIAGQRHPALVFANFGMQSLPSPSAIYMINVDDLGPDAQPRLVWASGARGRSESVAVPVPGGLAIGRIKTRNLLLVRCELPTS